MWFERKGGAFDLRLRTTRTAFGRAGEKRIRRVTSRASRVYGRLPANRQMPSTTTTRLCDVADTLLDTICSNSIYNRMLCDSCSRLGLATHRLATCLGSHESLPTAYPRFSRFIARQHTTNRSEQLTMTYTHMFWTEAKHTLSRVPGQNQTLDQV